MSSPAHRISLAKAWRGERSSDAPGDAPGDRLSIARVFHAPPGGVGTSKIFLVIALDVAVPSEPVPSEPAPSEPVPSVPAHNTVEEIFLNDNLITWCKLESPNRWDITGSILPTNRLKVVLGDLPGTQGLVNGTSTQFGLNVWLEISER